MRKEHRENKEDKGLSALSIIGMTFGLFFMLIGGVFAKAWQSGKRHRDDDIE